jgi:tetratricopeptide (TPR) repeat protein
MALIQMGLFMENLKLIKEGEERIAQTLEIDPTHHYSRFALGFATFARALYFSDETTFAQAAALFEKGIQEDCRSVENLHGLFQVYLAWGLESEDINYVEKGIAAIARVCALRPYSSLHLNEWGVSLMRSRQFFEEREAHIRCLEEAIDKFHKASELGEEEESFYNWGCALDLTGDLTGDEEDYYRAIELLSRSYEKKPHFFPLRYRLGMVYSHLGELTLNTECLRQAIDLFESAIKIDADDENLWCDLGYAQLNLAEILRVSVNLDEGMKYRTEAEKSLMHAARQGSGDAYYHLACLYSLSGLFEASLRCLIKAKGADCLPSKIDLEQDDWLGGVRETNPFQEFLRSQGEDD